MKKIAALLLCFLTLFLCSCSAKIERGVWEDEVYYNYYGNFKIIKNKYFDIYKDKQIKNDLGFVKKKNVLNDMVLASDFATIIVTVEKPDGEYTQEQYVESFIENTKRQPTSGSYSLAPPFATEIAKQKYTTVPVMYQQKIGDKMIPMYEFDHILKTGEYFVIIRITSLSQADAEIPLGMIKAIV